MGRFLSALLLSVSLGAVSVPAWAINVGQVSAFSSANQSLRMDVELIDLQGVRLQDVFMRVADEAEHERFGLQRPAWADGSVASILAKDAGSYVARLTSSRTVSSARVDFVVELRAGSSVSWHKVAADLGAGSPLVAAPKPQPASVAVPAPIVESPKVQPTSTPTPAPAPVSVPASAPVLEPASPDVGIDDLGTALIDTADTAADTLSDEESGFESEVTADADSVFEAVEMPAFEAEAEAPLFDDSASESAIKPYQYFNRVLILFFLLCFAIAALIGKAIKKVRKS